MRKLAQSLTSDNAHYPIQTRVANIVLSFSHFVDMERSSESRRFFDLVVYKTLLRVVPSSASSSIVINLVDFSTLLHLPPPVSPSSKFARLFGLVEFNTLFHWSSPTYSPSLSLLPSEFCMPIMSSDFCQPRPVITPLARHYRRLGLRRTKFPRLIFELSHFITTPLHH